MKKIKTQTEKISGRFGVALAFMALLLAVFGGQAQEVYHPITEGSVWSVSNNKYMTAGDTVLDGKTYLKIYRQVGDQSFEFSLENAEYFASIRNDSTEQKVYAYLPAGIGILDLITNTSIQTDTAMEVLIYDFSLNIGDTIIYYALGDIVVKTVAVRTEAVNIPVGWSGYSSVSHQYNESDTIVTLSDNSYRKQMFLHGLTYNAKEYVWIEGVGSIRGFDEGTQISLSDYGYGILLCFADSSGAAYQSGFDFDDEPDDCFNNGFGGDVQEREMLDIRIYPNPADDVLFIELRGGAGIANIGLYDLQGRAVGTRFIASATGASATVNMRDIPAGVYVLRVTDADGKEYHQKIVRK
ncbi:MAG: T9SS type A sorting domain-containing protein [Bacteroidales bacterium]|nr:T9SS type A sorting domain-containing protein [Bacteroidales bacterium]